jgi:hypothetical protein
MIVKGSHPVDPRPDDRHHAGDLNILLYTFCDRDHRTSRKEFPAENGPGRSETEPTLSKMRQTGSGVISRRCLSFRRPSSPPRTRGSCGWTSGDRTRGPRVLPAAQDGSCRSLSERAGGCVERCERRDICPRVDGRSAGAGIGHSHKLWGASSCRELGMCGPACPEGEKKVVITSTYRYVLSPPVP